MGHGSSLKAGLEDEFKKVPNLVGRYYWVCVVCITRDANITPPRLQARTIT